MFTLALVLAPWAAVAQPASSLVPLDLPQSVSNAFVYFTHAPGDFSRLFLVSQHGTIHIARLPEFLVDPVPFIRVPNIGGSGECGLLGLAFHPDYADNGLFYVYICRGAPFNAPAVMRFTRSAANPDLADPASASNVIGLGGYNGNHNGGWIGFGPEGYLYISRGDNGTFASSARDVTDSLFGKIIRIDVDGDDFPDDDTRNYRIPPDNPFVGVEGDDEIFAYGFRNPWRCSIDVPTAQMFIGDVGSSREELNVLPLGSPRRDFGWNCQEGAVNNCDAFADIVLPIAHYRTPPAPPLNISGNAVIGGEVYRGCAMPQIRGRYFFADLSGDVVSFIYDGVSVNEVVNHTQAFSFSLPFGFGHDAYGELYLGGNARIVKLVTSLTIGRDCNQNDIIDSCDLLSGALTDADGDDVPDECPNFADLDGDGRVGLPDLMSMLSAFGSCAGDPGYNNLTDFNSDACNDLQDLALLLSRFNG